jgi:hypothetical protein
MKKIYIILLLNDTIKIVDSAPQRKGNYLQNVRLFEAAGTLAASKIAEWSGSKYSLKGITEVEDWV